MGVFYSQKGRGKEDFRRCGAGFFLLKKELMVLRELVRFGPSILVEANESMCFGWFAHDGRGGFLAVGQWLLFFVEQLE